MKHKILAIGECMVEMSPQNGDLYAMGFAGDTFNTAWYAAKLAGDQVDVAYLSAIGDDDVSTKMKDFIQAAGVTPELKVRPNKSVGLYAISLRDGERSFSYWRAASAATTLADDLDDLPNLRAGDVAFFSGITLAILPDAGRANLRALEKARDGGVHIAFDPNLRPKLWVDDTQMCDWIMRGAAVADIVLPSFEDEHIFFNDADKHATAKRYENAGCKLCIVKDGADPVLAKSSEDEVLVSAQASVQIVDTTAAGDSFNAGFLTSYLTGAALEVAIKAGCALSAQVIAKPGALAEVR